MIEVVAAMIRKDGRFLICQRPEGKNCASMWEFPGGKVEPGETNEAALAREIREELRCGIAVREKLAETTHAYPSIEIHLTLYAADLTEGAPECLEHARIAWIGMGEAANYTFCPADAKLMRAMSE